MKYSTIGYILGQVLKFEGIFMLLPFLTGMIYHENEAYSYLIIGIICFVLGCLITLKKVKHPQIFNREGFVAVALSWIVLSIFGAIPFVITGEIPSYVDALFIWFYDNRCIYFIECRRSFKWNAVLEKL